MQEVFISHTGDARDVATTICTDLEGRDIRCWLADRDAVPGRRYADSIVRAIHNCDAMVVVVSPLAAQSSHMLNEVERGWTRGLRLVPFRVNGELEGGLSYYLGSLTHIDASNPPTDKDLDHLAASLSAMMRAPSSIRARKEPLAGPAIAVLPFRSLGGDSDQAYLAEGIAEDLAARLSRLRTLPVIAGSPTSAEGIQAVCRSLRSELAVDYVLDGQVRRVENALRIGARLMEARSAREIWASSYDRDIGGFLEIQDEITTSIASQIGVEVLERERDRSIRLDGSKLDNWERLLRADWHARRLTREENQAARELYEQAIAADPHFASAYGGAAMTHVYDLIMGWSKAPEASSEQAVRLGETAVHEDERLPSAHHALGVASLLRGDPERALEEAQRTSELHSSYALAHWLAGTSLVGLGRHSEALESIQRAMKLSPNDPWMFEFMSAAALACFGAECDEDAISYAQRSVYRRPTYPPPRFTMCASLALLGREDEAGEIASQARSIDPTLSFPATIERTLRTRHAALADRLESGWRRAGLLP